MGEVCAFLASQKLKFHSKSVYLPDVHTFPSAGFLRLNDGGDGKPSAGEAFLYPL